MTQPDAQKDENAMNNKVENGGFRLKMLGAALLLPMVPALAAGLRLGDREIFWGWLAGEFYMLFLAAAVVCVTTFEKVYLRLAAPATGTGNVEAVRFWGYGAVYYLLWCGALFMACLIL